MWNIKSLILILPLLLVLSGCNDSDGEISNLSFDPAADAASSKWGEMEWGKGTWGE